MKTGDRRRAPCPECGTQATFIYSEYDGAEWHICNVCNQAKRERNQAFQAECSRRFPTVSIRTTMMLMRGFGSMQSVLRATDDDLLAVRNCGKKTLAEFRSVWPEPMSDVATDDPWRDHAEMVTGVR